MYSTLGSENCWGFLSLSALLLLFTGGFVSYANAGPQLAVGAGAGYDSNVAPDYSNTNSGLGDNHYTLEALVGWQTAQRRGRPQGMQLQASYWIKDQQWQTYSDYDSRLQSGLLRVSHYGSIFNTDISAISAKADVDQTSYLTLHRISPGIGFRPTPHLYLRMQLDAMQKNYQQNNDRDSDRLGARLQFYWFLHSSGLMFNATMQAYDDQADKSRYSYQAQIARFSVRKRNLWLGHKVTNHLRLKLENRIYDERRDSRWRLELNSDWQLSQRWKWRWTIQQDEHVSDLAAYHYGQTKLETSLHWNY